MPVCQRCFGRKGDNSRHSTTGFSQNVIAVETRYQTLELSVSLLEVSVSLKAFLSDGRQPEVGFLHHLGVVWFKRSGKFSLFKRK